MAVDFFSWPNLHDLKNVRRSWGSNTRPSAYQADAHPIELPRPAICDITVKMRRDNFEAGSGDGAGQLSVPGCSRKRTLSASMRWKMGLHSNACVLFLLSCLSKKKTGQNDCNIVCWALKFRINQASFCIFYDIIKLTRLCKIWNSVDWIIWQNVNNNQKWVPLRAMKTFIRKKFNSDMRVLYIVLLEYILSSKSLKQIKFKTKLHSKTPEIHKMQK